jgi:hypothetical protein
MATIAHHARSAPTPMLTIFSESPFMSSPFDTFLDVKQNDQPLAIGRQTSSKCTNIKGFAADSFLTGQPLRQLALIC